MQGIFESINAVFKFIGPVSDFLWEFPTNYAWYANIPVLGKLSLAIILLVGTGIFFTIKTGFIQVRGFGKTVKELAQKHSQKTGLSPLASFLLSNAMRIGPGKIVGVTGAISVGGPGALVWMWISAFFGMATAYAEAVLAQVFKEKKEGEYIGGLPFYGRKLLGNRAWVGNVLSTVYIIYALFCLPSAGFNTVTGVGGMVEAITGSTIASNSPFYIVLTIIIILVTAVIAFGGIKKASEVSNKLVPLMSVVYLGVTLLLVVLNLDKVGYFFKTVFSGMFTPEALFGGAFGTVLSQGVKRGLMSNEAGQGTLTMAAATADTDHPSKQGLAESLGVFFDTLVLCTLTGFVVVMAHQWSGDGGEAWMALDRLPKYLTSAQALSPAGWLDTASILIISFCFFLFAYTCVIGFISFSEISANRISKNKGFINIVRLVCLLVLTFGLFTNLAGMQLDNLWLLSDLGNILIVYFNVPIVLLGSRYVFRCTKHYTLHQGAPIDEREIGVGSEAWKRAFEPQEA